ncbi:hypothetical protein ACVGOW_10820 [Pseudonocardia saturnea]
MRDQIRAREIDTRSCDVLGLDQLLVGADDALGRGRPGQSPPAGLVGDDRARESPARHDDTAGEPVRDPSRCLTGRLSLDRGPDHTRLGQRHPDVPDGYPRQFGSGDVHRLRCTDGIHPPNDNEYMIVDIALVRVRQV